MPFDGLDHRAALVPPYAYHPLAPATPDCLAIVLRQAYAFARHQGQPIGWQTYRIYLSDPAVYVTDGARFGEDDFVEIARFRRTNPPDATRAYFEAQFRVLPGRTVNVYHRITGYDGTHTAIGDLVTTRVEPTAPRDADARGLRQANDIAHLGEQVQIVRGSVFLGTLSDVQRTFTVEAYAVSLDATPVPEYYQPVMVFAWSASED